MNNKQTESISVEVNVKITGPIAQENIDRVGKFLETIGVELDGIRLHCDSCGANSKEIFQDYEEVKAGVIALGWVNAGADDFCPVCRVAKGL